MNMLTRAYKYSYFTNMIKVIFIDIDGVLNCSTTKERHFGAVGIDPDKVKLLSEIVAATGALVVLSSTWRLIPEAKKEVVKFVKIHDQTPDLSKMNYARERGMEVAEWLVQQPEKTIGKYVIIDDGKDFLVSQTPNLIHTSWLTGLTEKQAQQAIRYLNS